MHPRSEREHFDREVAVSQDGKPLTDHPTRPRKAYVAELTGLLDLSGWGAGARLLCRRERAHPGAQLSLIETDGWRTRHSSPTSKTISSQSSTVATAPKRIEDSHALGLSKLPFRAYQMNEAWMQLVLCAQDLLACAKALTLTDELARCNPTRFATACCTKPDASPAQAVTPSSASPTTGPGQQTSPPPALASMPCPCPRGEPAGSRAQSVAAPAVPPSADHLRIAQTSAKRRSDRLHGSHQPAFQSQHPPHTDSADPSHPRRLTARPGLASRTNRHYPIMSISFIVNINAALLSLDITPAPSFSLIKNSSSPIFTSTPSSFQ